MTKLQKFIELHKPLFWDISPQFFDKVSKEIILERTLQYGDIPDFKELINIIGYHKANLLFKKLKSKKIINLKPITINYFNLVFKKHVS